MLNYTLLKEQLKADILTAWSLNTYFGQPVSQIEKEHAVVKTDISREYVIRHGWETYSFTIMGRFLRTENPEEFLLGKAEDLIQILSPYVLDENNLPSTPTSYAGVGEFPYVTSVKITEREDSDKLVNVEIVFSVQAVFYS